MDTITKQFGAKCGNPWVVTLLRSLRNTEAILGAKGYTDTITASIDTYDIENYHRSRVQAPYKALQVLHIVTDFLVLYNYSDDKFLS